LNVAIKKRKVDGKSSERKGNGKEAVYSALRDVCASETH
jgi:hypothetical protein